MQLWYSFRKPVQRAADEVEIFFAGESTAAPASDYSSARSSVDPVATPTAASGSDSDLLGTGTEEL
jgi:hypothetical protein